MLQLSCDENAVFKKSKLDCKKRIKIESDCYDILPNMQCWLMLLSRILITVLKYRYIVDDSCIYIYSAITVCRTVL